MILTKEKVAALFDANEIVGGPAKVHMSGAGGGQGLGGIGPDTFVATSSGIYGRLGDIRAAQAGAVAAADEVSGAQSGGRRRLSSRRYRKTQKGGKRQPRLNVRISARIRLSRRSRQ